MGNKIYSLVTHLKPATPFLTKNCLSTWRQAHVKVFFMDAKLSMIFVEVKRLQLIVVSFLNELQLKGLSSGAARITINPKKKGKNVQ